MDAEERERMCIWVPGGVKKLEETSDCVPIVLLWSGLILHSGEEIIQNPFKVLAGVECNIIYLPGYSELTDIQSGSE